MTDFDNVKTPINNPGNEQEPVSEVENEEPTVPTIEPGKDVTELVLAAQDFNQASPEDSIARKKQLGFSEALIFQDQKYDDGVEHENFGIKNYASREAANKAIRVGAQAAFDDGLWLKTGNNKFSRLDNVEPPEIIFLNISGDGATSIPVPGEGEAYTKGQVFQFNSRGAKTGTLTDGTNLLEDNDGETREIEAGGTLTLTTDITSEDTITVRMFLYNDAKVSEELILPDIRQNIRGPEDASESDIVSEKAVSLALDAEEKSRTDADNELDNRLDQAEDEIEKHGNRLRKNEGDIRELQAFIDVTETIRFAAGKEVQGHYISVSTFKNFFIDPRYGTIKNIELKSGGEKIPLPSNSQSLDLRKGQDGLTYASISRTAPNQNVFLTLTGKIPNPALAS